MSSNIYNDPLNTQRWGVNKQSDYKLRMQIIPKLCGMRINQVKKDRLELSNFFHDLIKQLANARATCARDHLTEDAEDFGSRRDKVSIENRDYLLRLQKNEGHYTKYSKIFCKTILAHLKQKNPVEFTISAKSENVYHQLRSSFELCHMNVIEWSDSGYDEILPEQFPKWFPVKHLGNKPLTVQENLKFKSALERMQKEKPEFYERFQLHALFYFLKFLHPEILTPRMLGRFLVGKTKLDIDGEMCISSRIITWIPLRLYYQRNNPIANMLNDSSIIMLHPRASTIVKTLNVVARFFADAVCSGRDNLEDMQNSIAKMIYYWSYCQPYSRGSSSIGEMLVASVYDACGFSVRFKKPLDLEALTTPILNDYIEKYSKMIALTANDPKASAEEGKTP